MFYSRNPQFTEADWSTLLGNMLTLQEEVYTCIDPSVCYQVIRHHFYKFIFPKAFKVDRPQTTVVAKNLSVVPLVISYAYHMFILEWGKQS